MWTEIWDSNKIHIRYIKWLPVKFDNSDQKLWGQTESCKIRTDSKSVRFQLPLSNCIDASSRWGVEGKKTKTDPNQNRTNHWTKQKHQRKKKRDCFLEQLVAKPTRKSLNESSTQMQKLKELCNGGGGEPGKLSKHPKNSPKGGSLEAVKKKKP